MAEEPIYANPDLLDAAKSRCTNCLSETSKDGKYWCDESDCDITAVLDCQEFGDEVDGRIN